MKLYIGLLKALDVREKDEKRLYPFSKWSIFIASATIPLIRGVVPRATIPSKNKFREINKIAFMCTNNIVSNAMQIWAIINTTGFPCLSPSRPKNNRPEKYPPKNNAVKSPVYLISMPFSIRRNGKKMNKEELENESKTPASNARTYSFDFKTSK